MLLLPLSLLILLRVLLISLAVSFDPASPFLSGSLVYPLSLSLSLSLPLLRCLLSR